MGALADSEGVVGASGEWTAGLACTDLIARPQSWINRRVETVELLSHEETRRRVSIDFTLSDEALSSLASEHGIVVPLTPLTKEPRRNFDLRDEAGRAVPVLGRWHNGRLAHVALLNAARAALPDGEWTAENVADLVGDLRRVVVEPPRDAGATLADLQAAADAGDDIRAAVVADPICRSLLETLWANYVLFAVLAPGGANRRILKYSYGEEFDRAVARRPIRESLAPSAIGRRAWRPDRRPFVVMCPGASHAGSFHIEVAVPEDLRIELAVLHDGDTDGLIGDLESNVDRASLYAPRPVDASSDVGAFVVVAPQRGGMPSQAAVTSAVVAGLLWLGVTSGLDGENPAAAVSILLAGAALFSGVSATQGRHQLVRVIFSASRRWLTIVTVVALAASASLAMEIPSRHPLEVWRLAAAVASLAALRLGWAAIRAPR